MKRMDRGYPFTRKILKSYSRLYSSYVQSDSISVFDVSKKENNILIYNYNTNETYNLGDVPQIIRDMKINEVLNDD